MSENPSRRRFTTEQKVSILRRHLVDKVPVSDLCDEYRIQPSLFYVWQRQALEHLDVAVEAYADLRARGFPHDLVLAGVRYFDTGDLERSIARHGLSEAIHLLGYVEDDDMPSLYSLAEVFVYPSLYEGFGIPPLEAMACGTPVVASSTTSIPEAVGTAACLIDPLDVGSIAAGRPSAGGRPLRGQAAGRRA